MNSYKNDQKISAALCMMYDAIYHIELRTDHIEKIRGNDREEMCADTMDSAKEWFADVLAKFVESSCKDVLAEFFNLNTLEERLESKSSISREYLALDGIWRRASFVVEERDESDFVTEVLYLEQIIEEEKQSELAEQQELKKAVEEARRENAAKSDFLSKMSHDIRTPLNGLLGMLENAEKNLSNPEKVRYCHERMRYAASHLLALVNDILDIRKLEDGELSFERTPYDIREVLESCWSMLEMQAIKSDVTLQPISSGSVTHPYLIGSPLYIRQIFMNILSNAIKYNKPGGKIQIRVETVEQQEQTIIYKFMISDTGIGMTPEFQEHIFEPFVQEDSEAHNDYNGSGLGMAIVHHLVEEMGGNIQVNSQKDIGTTFTLTLPFTIDEHKDTLPKIVEIESEVDLSGTHVLVVEDNELNLEIIVFSLEEAGIRVSQARNGKEAVAFFERSIPGEIEAILMDIRMPVMNGLEAAEEIRSLDRSDAATVPIIALSANAFVEDIQKSKKAGMNEHLGKPLEMEKVLKTIAKYKNSFNNSGYLNGEIDE